MLMRFVAQSGGFEVGKILFQPCDWTVTIGHRTVQLTRNEFLLLNLLAQHSGTLLSRTALLRMVQGYTPNISEQNIDAYIGLLRRKLALFPTAAPQIQSMYPGGYKLRVVR